MRVGRPFERWMFLLWRFLGFRRLVALWVLRRLWRALSARRASKNY